MERRVLVVAILVVAAISAGVLGQAALAPADGQPTYAPDRLAGFNQTANATGDRAREIISQLHQRPSNVTGFEKAIVARYGPEDGDGIVLYVSVYNESAGATADIDRMVTKIRRSPEFEVNETTVADTTVYKTTRGGVAFAFFSYRETAYWVSHPRTLETPTDEVVEAVVSTNRRSRQRFPWSLVETVVT